ncbi:NLR family CARD domain-containing protein 4 [Holothuria leucospilota]|uniref:NLR family CARD domain-containing protein 4 n=1 Tax=Holothuria leucospilota TaxID=206669 RepID=A0A9Q1HCU3_HOLLE|nr:NLR family CARD domain-containing protein 4 [Holothuria leucospilota]
MTFIPFFIVTPKQPFPVITECGGEHQFCLRSLHPSSGISCSVYDARPMVELHWFERTTDDKKILTESNVTSVGDVMYTSRITTTNYFNDDILLELLVCKAKSSPPLLQRMESMVLVQRNDRTLPFSTPVLKYFKKNAKLTLSCSDKDILFLVWSAMRSPSDFENIAYAIFTNYNVLETFSEDFKLDSTGSLVISQVQVQHEGLYNCVHGDGVHEDVKTYEVVVYVPPDSIYPVVEECGDQDNCFLEVDFAGNLTCLVKRIRPQVELEWVVVDKSQSWAITFKNKEKLIKDNGGTFDVSLKTTYHTNVGYQNNITVQCRVSGKHAELFDLRRNINLLLRTAKTRTFITELKRKYENLYGKIFPIPYNSKISFKVDEVFINSGIEFLPSNGHDTWQRLDSYLYMFQDSWVESKRIIIEGFPGYGKSTLLLHIAYDWHHKASGSPLDDVEILILLPLRNIGSIKSVFQAIKELLLPKDTQLTESDIQNIVQNCSSVVMLLDGYDEYPDKDSNVETDVQDIIEMKMLQECKVILTTRPPQLPKSYSSNTKRLRLLGFDENSRLKYILKSVTKNQADAIKAEERLKAFPILKDLCESPLFFAMFAHVREQIGNKEDVEFNSVTTYFQHMVTCFHTHMQSKTKYEILRRQYENFESNHDSLNKVAFKNLRNIEQEFVLEKEQLTRNFDEDFYKFYVRIGILKEEKVIVTSDRSPVVQNNTEVRFYHRLFHEWYAAHYLADNIKSTENTKLLKKLNPAEFPDVYRFACGLDRYAADKIIKYLDKIGSQNFKLLCLVERDGKVDNLIRILGEKCAKDISIRNDDNILKQRSTLQLIKIASHHKASHIFQHWLICSI